MKDQRLQLRRELRQAGASSAELSALVPVASDLALLKDRSPAKAKHVKYSQWRWRSVLRPLSFGATGLALGVLLIVFAQAAQPTSWLYPVQKLSDAAAIRLHPQYRADVMMKRARQVNQLVASHAGSQRVLATLADYTVQARAYKTLPRADYSAFEYCKANLEQAAAKASPAERQAIATSLKSLETS